MSALPHDRVPTNARSVAVHPERTGDPRTVRWQVAGGLPNTLGRDALHALVTAGILASAAMGPDHLTTTLEPGRSWPVDGPGIRTAVQEAVAAARAADADADAAAADPDGALA